MDAALLLKLLDAGLAISSTLQQAGVNYQEVLDAQAAAAVEGRELNSQERQAFINQAQAAVDSL